jgi:hypothetical protein
MAINSSNSPYESWEELRKNSDYRARTTQNNAYVRQALAQERYLRSSYRVNQGPEYNTRRTMSKNSGQNPHVYGSEDMWGWQNWTETRKTKTSSSLAPGLYEVNPADDAPGTQYPGPSRVQGWAGCSSCKRRRL